MSGFITILVETKFLHRLFEPLFRKNKDNAFHNF